MDAETVYLDHAATTPVHPRVLETMWPYFSQHFGNPSSHYPLADQARSALDWARQTVATTIGARSSEIIFTSGGSESNNLALQGVALALRDRGDHIITTRIEHHAVLRTCEYLERVHGFRVTYLPVDRWGLVDLAALERALDDRAILVSVMLANNEIGTIQPIAEIARLTRSRGVPLHTDAVQALPTLPVDVHALDVDLLTISAHKCYGPKGVGALYVRRGTAILPQIYGGHQERDRRAGTENVAGVVGLATALQLVRSHDPTVIQRLRDRLIDAVLERIPGATLTGHPTMRLASHASFGFAGVAGEAVLVALTDRGIACSSGSACAVGASDPSHVLTAIGQPDTFAQTAVRLTLGLTNTAEQIERVIDLLPQIVASLRGVEPDLIHTEA